MKLNPHGVKNLDNVFVRIGISIANHPWRWLLSIMVCSALLASQLLSIRIDSSVEGMLDSNSPAKVRFQEFKERFGQDDMFWIIIETDEIFTPHFIENLRSFHRQIEYSVPYTDRVDSLINARHTYGEDDSLIVKELLEESLPTEPLAIEALKAHVYNNPAYQDYLVSADRHLVSVIVSLATDFVEQNQNGETITRHVKDAQMVQASEAIHNVIELYKGKLSDDIQLGGGPELQVSMTQAMQRDMAVFSVLAIVMIGFVCFMIFRRASGVLMPISVMSLNVILTISCLPLFDDPMQMNSAFLPSFYLRCV